MGPTPDQQLAGDEDDQRIQKLTALTFMEIEVSSGDTLKLPFS